MNHQKIKIEYLCNNWLISFKNNEESLDKSKQITLLCFPYASGNSLIYKEWQPFINHNVELLAVNLPGHGNRLLEPVIENIDDLMKEIHRNISPYLKNKKIVFFGHSLGALLCFEYARYIKKFSNFELLCIIVSAYSLPDIEDKDEDEVKHRNILTDDEVLQTLVGLDRLSHKSIIKNEEMRNLILKTMRSEMILLDSYNYQKEPVLSVPIVAFYSKNDDFVNSHKISNWKNNTKSWYDKFQFEGGHFFIEEYTEQVVKVVNDILNRV
ncbi:MAG: alpha/beta fold hydrolase [Defluviitaleaceae bacterium]|nr:alpha/beta fold hydrolase [Defluviitaleaceae bacterium]